MLPYSEINELNLQYLLHLRKDHTKGQLAEYEYNFLRFQGGKKEKKSSIITEL